MQPDQIAADQIAPAQTTPTPPPSNTVEPRPEGERVPLAASSTSDIQIARQVDAQEQPTPALGTEHPLSTPHSAPSTLPPPSTPPLSPAGQSTQARIRQEIAYEKWRKTDYPTIENPNPPTTEEFIAQNASDRHAKTQAIHHELASPTLPLKNPPLAPTPIQERAIPLLVQGLSDNEVARRIGVHRTTVNRWRLFDPIFIARLNRSRQAVWAHTLDALRNLLPQAVSILAETMQTEGHPHRTRAAIQLLKIAGTSRLAPTIGPTTTADVLFDRALATQRQNYSPHDIFLNSPPSSQDLDAELQEAIRQIHDPSELQSPELNPPELSHEELQPAEPRHESSQLHQNTPIVRQDFDECSTMHLDAAKRNSLRIPSKATA